MCLPCWPVKDITLEQDSPPEGHEMFQYVWNANRGEWVPTIRDRVSEAIPLGGVGLFSLAFAAKPQDHTGGAWGSLHPNNRPVWIDTGNAHHIVGIVFSH